MRRNVPRLLVTALTAMAAASLAAFPVARVAAQVPGGAAGPTQILVPALQVQGGVDGKTGERIANEVRDLLGSMSTHGVISEKDMNASMKRFQLEDLDEITARQLAQQMEAQLVMWGVVEEGGAGLQADVRFIDVRTGDQIEVLDATGADNEAVAQAIFAAFQQKAEGMRLASVCSQQVAGQQFEQALATCDQALAIVPRSATALAGRAAALMNAERWPDALTAYQTLVEIDPANQDVLLGAGLASSRVGNSDQALEYFNRYMEVNPADVQARIALAGQILQTGDFLTAYRMLEPAAAENQANAEFQKFYFTAATAAGQQMQATDSAAAQPYYQAALNAYQVAFGSGAEPDAAAMRLLIAVQSALGNSDAAMQTAREATAKFPTDASILSQYAAALNDAGQFAEEAQVLSQVIAIDPAYESIYVRRGNALLKAGDRQAALADFQQSVSRGNAVTVAAVLYGMGAQAYQAERFEEASDLLDIAAQHAQGDVLSKTQFLLGVSLYRQAEAIAKANTEQLAAEAQRALPLFQRAVAALQATSEAQAASVLSAAQQYVVNQEAVIAAGRS